MSDPGPPPETKEAAPPPAAEVKEVTPPAPAAETEKTPEPQKETPAPTPGSFKVTDPSKMFGQKQPEPAPAAEEEDVSIPDDTPTQKAPAHVRKLANAFEAKKREYKKLESTVSNLTQELAELKKQPRTAANAQEIADVTAEREAAKQAKAEADALRSELAETRKASAVFDVRSLPGFKKEESKLAESANKAKEVLQMAEKEYGVNVKINALVKEWRADGVQRPLYNSVVSALRDAGDPAGEEMLKSQLKAIVKAQDAMYEIEQAGLKEKEEWEANKIGAFAKTIKSTRDEIGAKHSIYNKSSQEYMQLPQESKDAIAHIESRAEEAAKIAINTKDPQRLAKLAYETQLGLEVANASYANAMSRIEELTAEHEKLKAKLAGYERSFNGAGGGLNRSNPTQGSPPPKVVTDPSRMRLFT